MANNVSLGPGGWFSLLRVYYTFSSATGDGHVIYMANFFLLLELTV